MTYDVVKYTDDMQEFIVMYSTSNEELADAAYDVYSAKFPFSYVDVVERFN